jgi:monoamine oxidase
MARRGPAPWRCDDIAVLGAGVSGLVVATELERYGTPVTVYEADGRVGGRIYTRRFGTGATNQIAEFGAMRIPRSHAIALACIRDLGLEDAVRPFGNILGDPGNLVRVGTRFLPVGDAVRAVAAELTAAAARPPRRATSALFAASLLVAVDATAPRELRELAGTDVPTVMVIADAWDLEQFAGPSGVDVQRVLEARPEVRTVFSPRMQSFLDDLGTEYNGDLVHLAGGMSRIVDALLDRIRGPVHVGHAVHRIDAGADGVALAVDGPGGSEVREHPVVVCTIPFSVLRGIPLTGIDADKQAAIHDLDYGSATKVAVHVARPFWRDRGIACGGSVVGGLSRQAYYPNGWVDPARPAVLLGSYAIAEDADVLGRMSRRSRHRTVLGELRAMHPELGEPGMVLDVDSIAWGEHPWNRGCAARRWNTDDAGREREAIRAARPVGRLFFAGEHCSARPAWIDSAIASAHRAVAEIRSRPDLLARDRQGWSA